MFDRFEDDARDAMRRCRETAHSLGHEFIAAAHLLASVDEAPDSVPARALVNLSVEPTALRAKIVELMPKGAATDARVQLPFTPGAKAMLEAAGSEASLRGDKRIGFRHLFLGALHADDAPFLRDVVTRSFRDLGTTADAVAEETLRLVGSEL